jgi:hypothetical protein
MEPEQITVVITEVVEQITVIVAEPPREQITVTISEAMRGEPGAPAYTYVAYARDATGQGFSPVPSESLPFRAEIQTSQCLSPPTPEHFARAVWVRYLGVEFGTGPGQAAPGNHDHDVGDLEQLFNNQLV